MENNNYNGSEIAIVGLAARVPGADDIETFYGNLKGAKESITRFSDEELIGAGVDCEQVNNSSYVKAKGLLKGADLFDASFFGYSPKEAEFMDPQQRVLLECAWTALEQAGYDPQHSPGPVGAFVGGSQNTYFFKNLLPAFGIEGMDKAGVALVHSGTDLLATTLSYKLNLQGPSLTIQTACSTSLVAVHQAVMSLLSGECNMALAGGVSITPPFIEGYEYMQGGIKSADGHCRTFDEKASGTLPGNGVGLVVLKRLDDALADGDQIYAVIRGTAVNNDGSAKVGFTAPSIDGQVKVIQDALNVSGVNPSTITYVEAHGTGTSIGDPIEVRALTQAYRTYTDETGYCAIGSVKTNIGHLDAAAGVIGLIKTVCSMQYKTFLPSLHFEKANPKIPFDETPFYVTSKLQSWESPNGPRRAGVSSFGIGGTNAHVIVEEAPTRRVLPSKKRSLVIPISAKSPLALKTKVEELAAHLDKHDLPFADVAFTLQTGRQEFDYRLAIMTDSNDGLKQALRQSKVGQPPVRNQQEPVFLLPGQGSQYVNMGKELYENEPSFRAIVDRCAELLFPVLELDIRNVMYPVEADREKAEAQIRETSITQSVLFTIEYSLAQWWMEQGVTPRTFIGHSVGEYVAACLAGVFELEDALRLVAARGKLMQSVQPGSMLSVPLPLPEVRELLKKYPISLAAVNAPSMYVVSGQTEAVTALKKELENRGVQARLLRTSHAFHSSMMEPILEQFFSIVANTPRQTPAKLWISNISGTWITAEEAVNPRYWSQHIRETVDFERGVQVLLQEGVHFFLEVGPGDTLSTFVRQTAQLQGTNKVILSSIQAIARKTRTDDVFLQESLCRLWQAGGLINWHAVWGDEQRLRVALPSYPFERRRHWIEAKPNRHQYQVIPAEDKAEYELVEEEVNTRPILLSEYKAPQTDAEKVLVQIWEGLTGVHPIGIHDNFFEIGGHSLLGIQMVAKVKERFKVEISVDAVSAAPTVAELHSIIQLSEQKDEITELPTIGIDAENLYEPFPLTDLAQGYLIGRSNAFELGNIGSHFYYEVESNHLDLERLERSFQQVIDRHEMMRAIVQEDGEQRILKNLRPYKIQVLDLGDLSEEKREKQVNELRATMVKDIPPADRWPMYDLRAVRLQGSTVRVMMRFDYLIMDALTFQVISRDWQAFYEGWDNQLPELGTTYRDYMIALKEIEQGPLYERAKKYWFNRIHTLPAAPQLPTLHTATDKPVLVGRRGKLDSEVWKALQTRAARANLSASGILLAAYSEVLGKWSEYKDFTINLPTFNRLDLHKHVHDLVGSFTSTTLVEVRNSESKPFEERAKQLQHQLLQDLDYRLVGGVQVLRERKRRQSSTNGTGEMMPFVFTGFVNVENREKRLELMEWMGSMVYRDNQTPQCLLDNQVSMEGDQLIYNWDALESVFPKGLMQAMFDAYGELLHKLALDDEAWQSHDPVELPEYQQKSREDANATGQDLPSGMLHELVFEQARLHPKALAVTSPDRQMTYQELTAHALKLGHLLRATNTLPNQLVAVLMEKGWEQGVGILAVIAAGSAYLPIDPYLPTERVRQLLDEGGVKIILTQSHLSQIVQEKFSNYEILVVTAEEDNDTDVAPLPSVQCFTDLAYVIFTSGSTGRPKGVMIDHRAVVNTLQDINNRFNVQCNDRVLALSNLNFDLSVYDFFGTWLAGGTVVVPNSKMERDPEYLLDLLVSERVTVWNSVPALMEMLVHHGERYSVPGELALRLTLLSGDWIPLSLPNRLRKLASATEVISLGGATEAAIWSIFYPIGEVNPQWNSIPYGRPLANQTMHVLNPVTGAPCPDWVPGDLYIGGIGLSQGYWQDPERTAQSFVMINGQPMYRTGDIGLWKPNGQIEFLGRSDFQVKIRGFRIELGEIETLLRNHPKVNEAIVVAREDQPGRKRLIGYIIAEQTPGLESELISFVKQKLPDYMVPQAILVLGTLPITPNGKIDRKTLPAPEIELESCPTDYMAPRTDTEQKLAQIWEDVLQIENVGTYDHFFERSGDSLLATRMLTLVRKTFNVRYSLRQLFEEPVLASMASSIDAMRELELPKEQEISKYLNMVNELSEEEIDALLLQLGGKIL